MTAVVMSRGEWGIYIISDVLAKTQRQDNSPHIPTRRWLDKSMLDAKKYTTIQKLYTFDNRLAIAFAGNTIGIEPFLKNLRKVRFSEISQRDEVISAMSSCMPANFGNFSAVGNISFPCSQKGIRHFHCNINAETIRNQVYGGIIIDELTGAGAGCEALALSIRCNRIDPATFPEHYTRFGSASQYEIARRSACSTIGKVLSDEVFFGGGLRDGWGAGYEAVAFDGSIPKRVDNIANFFWFVDVTTFGRPVIRFLPKMIMQRYTDGGILQYETIDARWEREAGRYHYDIKSIFDCGPVGEISDTDFERTVIYAEYVHNHVLISHKKRDTFHYCDVLPSKLPVASIRYVGPNHFGIFFVSLALKTLKEQVERECGESFVLMNDEIERRVLESQPNEVIGIVVGFRP